MNSTPIEWVKNPDGSQGYTWNPITGCLNGCPYCYARQLANGRLRKKYLANTLIAADPYKEESRAFYDDPFYPRFWDDKCYEIVPQGKDRIKPRGVFVCDMSDLFGKGIPERWTSDVLDSIRRRPDWWFYLLTKQPQNLLQYNPFPSNCWVGFTATGHEMFWKGISYIKEIDATRRFISFEPLLENIHVLRSPHNTLFHGNPETELIKAFKLAGIHWIIIGAQNNPTIMPERDWVRTLVGSAEKAGVKVFLKNSLRPLFEANYQYRGGHMLQEMPND